MSMAGKTSQVYKLLPRHVFILHLLKTTCVYMKNEKFLTHESTAHITRHQHEMCKILTFQIKPRMWLVHKGRNASRGQ